MDNEAVRIAVALRLGLDVCVPHTCRCGAQVNATGTHGLICKRAVGRIARHQGLNDVIARAFATTGPPITEEPNGLSRLDGKRPGGLTLVPWAQGKPLTWDLTVICTSVSSYLAAASQTAGPAAEQHARRVNIRAWLTRISLSLRNPWTHELHCCHSFVRSGSPSHSQDK